MECDYNLTKYKPMNRLNVILEYKYEHKTITLILIDEPLIAPQP